MLSLNQNQGGLAIILTLLILTSVLVITLGIAAILNRSLKISQVSSESNVAYLAAESGAERALWMGRKTDFDELILAGCSYVDLDTPGCSATPYEHSAGAGATYLVTYSLTGDEINIFVIIGRYFDVKRSIEVQYKHAE